MSIQATKSNSTLSLHGTLSPRAGGGKVKDVTYDNVSVVNENGVAIIPPYPSIPVTDVKYNNESVVENGVANIPPYPVIPPIPSLIPISKSDYDELSSAEKLNKFFFVYEDNDYSY